MASPLFFVAAYSAPPDSGRCASFVVGGQRRSAPCSPGTMTLRIQHPQTQDAARPSLWADRGAPRLVRP